MKCKIIYNMLLFLQFILFSSTSMADSASSSNKKGIEAYNMKEYEESVKKFTDALVEKPNMPELRYNRGTVLSVLGKNDDALNELSIAAEKSENKQLSASAYFNAGNTLFMNNNFQGAIEEYKKALKFDQSSGDIRHNLELAMRKLKEQQQQKEEQKSQEDGKKKEENEEEKQDRRKQDDETKEKKDEQSDDQQNKNKNQENKQQDQQQQQSKQQESENRPMTLEEAQRILDAVNEEEEKALSLRRMKMKTEMRQGDDW